MELSTENSESCGSGTEQELVAESPACQGSTFASIEFPGDAEKEFKNLMSMIADIEREIGHNRNLRCALQEEVTTHRTRHQEVETLLTVRLRELERNQKDLTSLHSENEQLTTELTSSQEERGEGIKEINRLKSDLEKKKQEMQILEENRSNLEETLKVVKLAAEAKERELHESIRQLNHDREKLEERLKQKTQEASREHALVEDLKRENQQLEIEVTSLRKTRVSFKNIYDSLKNVHQMCNSPPSDPPQPQVDS